MSKPRAILAEMLTIKAARPRAQKAVVLMSSPYKKMLDNTAVSKRSE